MKNDLKYKGGVTLVELMIALALLSLAIALGMNFLLTGTKVFSKGSSQYNVQSSVRFAAANVSDAVRFALTAEILPANPNTFNDTNDYIYLDNDNLVHSFINDQGDRSQRILSRGLTSVSFSDNSGDEQLLGLHLSGIENNQDFQIELDIALPNFLIMNQKITGEAAGAALVFFRDQIEVTEGGSVPLTISPGSSFNLVTGKTRVFHANKEVIWTSSMPGNIIIDPTTTASKSAIAEALGSVNSTAVITATTVGEDPQQTKSIVVTIVQEEYSAKIIRSSTNVAIEEVLNVEEGQSEFVHLEFTPYLSDPETDILEIKWTTEHNPGDPGYTFDVLGTDDDMSVQIRGFKVGNPANLSVSVTLLDNTVINVAIIVNVMYGSEYARLSELGVNVGELSPEFDPSKLSYNYVYTESANSEVYITVHSAGPDSTVYIAGSPVVKGVPYKIGYKSKETFLITITVNEPGKTTSLYTITSN